MLLFHSKIETDAVLLESLCLLLYTELWKTIWIPILLLFFTGSCPHIGKSCGVSKIIYKLFGGCDL